MEKKICKRCGNEYPNRKAVTYYCKSCEVVVRYEKKLKNKK